MPLNAQPSEHNYDRLALAFVLLNALVWWAVFSVGRSSLDPFGDMAEAYSWGLTWQWGYDKHPPLSAWMAAAWFKLFPTRDWAYYLLAGLNQATAFWFVFLAGKRWLTPAQALLAVMLTSLVPIFGPDTGFKFNANSAMLPWVAIFAWSLIAALQTKAKRYLLVAGLAGGAACLVKYWAPVMLAAISVGVVLIVHQNRTFSWQATAGALLAVAGLTLLVFAPHVAWAVAHRWPGLRYAHAAHDMVVTPLGLAAAMTTTSDLLLVALLPSLALLIGLTFTRKIAATSLERVSGPTLREKPVLPLGFRGASIFLLTVLFNAASAQLAGVSVAVKWLIPAWLFFGWLLCSVMPTKLDPRRLIWPTGVFVGLYWVALLAYVAWNNPSLDIQRDSTNERRLVANDVTQFFRSNFGQPLRFIGGNEALSFSTSFYSMDHPIAIANLDFARTFWVDESQVRAAGVAVICLADQLECIKTAIDQLGTPQVRREWQGVTKDGLPASVHELFYAPQRLLNNTGRQLEQPH